jgi:hypothetical protein
MLSSGMLHRVAIVRTDVSEECIFSIVRVTRICAIGDVSTLIASVASYCYPAPSSAILVTLMM